jgi:hypothetical protein
MNSYTYLYSGAYGSDEWEKKNNSIIEAKPSNDRMSVRLKIDSLRPHFVHELHADGVTNEDGLPLLHPSAYYTLNRIPAK